MAVEETVETVDTNQTKAQRKILVAMRKDWKAAYEADEEQRRDGMEDMKFTVVPGHQWDENQKKERGNRPCYEFNKVRVTAKRIINMMRANPAQGKVRAVEDSDKDGAEIYEGLIRNAWDHFNGEAVVDYASEYQVIAGYGAWRLTTDYSRDDVFDQDIGVEAIPNPFNLFGDPADKDMLKRNARFWVLTEKMPSDEYEEKWGEAKTIDFPSHEFDDDEDWNDDDEVRVAEYWYKEPVERELLQLETGPVVWADSEDGIAALGAAIKVKASRKVKTFKIMMCICSGSAVLEGPVEWAGSKFPFVPLYGEYYVVDGKIYWNGITRFAKDPQRSYNVSRTAITETIQMAPQAKFWATADQAEGLDASWKVAHQKNYPFMLYNADPKAPGAPQRMGGPEIPMALIQEAQLAAEEINMVTGVYQADLGAPNQATSGKQEALRQSAGNIATFNYQDNRANAIAYTWELFVDLIPNVYTSEREMRVLGADDQEKYVRINQFVGENRINDVTTGKYDVTMSVGPSFTTKRQEAAESYQALIQGNPQLFPIIGDLIMKATDLPYADEIAERLQIMLPPEIQQAMNEEQDIPPEVQMMMQQAQQAMQMVEQQMQVVQQEAQQSEMGKAEVEKLMADLETKQARFEAKVAKELAKLAKVEAGLVKQSLEDSAEGVIEAAKQESAAINMEFNSIIGGEMATAMQAIQEMSVAFAEQAAQAIDAIRDEKDEKPVAYKVTSQRVNGKLEAVPEWGYFRDGKIVPVEITPDAEND